MNSNIHPFYRHSGKFSPLAPVMVLLAAVVAAIPLGLLYAYLVKWIPFIYLNFMLTIGYGFAFGLLARFILKLGKVRNSMVGLGAAMAMGMSAWYFSWTGHFHTLVSDAPWVATPQQVWVLVKMLYAEGSWSLGAFSHDLVNGVPLAVVWVVEGAAIVGLTTIVGYSYVRDTPYCEQHNCWLDQEKVMDKLDAFTRPAHLGGFRVGDIAPLEEAQPRLPGTGKFARLTLRHSPHCDDFCTLSIANIDVSVNEKGKSIEKAQVLMTNLLVPKSMFEYLAQFDHATARVQSPASS